MRSAEELLLARLRFRHLQLVAEVERQGTLGKAAIALSVSQPALSKALKEIEGLLAERRNPPAERDVISLEHHSDQ